MAGRDALTSPNLQLKCRKSRKPRTEQQQHAAQRVQLKTNPPQFCCISRSQAERANGSELRIKADALVNECATLVWDCWSATNNAINKRATEQMEAKNKILLQLHKVRTHHVGYFSLSCCRPILLYVCPGRLTLFAACYCCCCFTHKDCVFPL